jgi:hypothetical protein
MEISCSQGSPARAVKDYDTVSPRAPIDGILGFYADECHQALSPLTHSPYSELLPGICNLCFSVIYGVSLVANCEVIKFRAGFGLL